MTKSKEVLLNIYNEAKKRRIVINQEEFAKAVGKSRAHLFNKMVEIPDNLVLKAKKLLETKDVSHENKKAIINDNNGDVDKELNRLIELSIKHEATLEVLRLLIENILADLKGKSIVLVSEEVQQAIKMKADRLFDEFVKKR